MKHAEMVLLMGQVVTVTSRLARNYEHKWRPQKCPPWAGWIVGFTYKMDGTTTYGHWEDGGATFRETSRQLCVLVKSWPTKQAVPVPLDGYTMGGQPEPPDYGGWRAWKTREAVEAAGGEK